MILQVPASFSLNDLLVHLREDADLEGFYTTREWAEHFGISEERMRAMIQEATARNLVQCSRDKRERIDGVMVLTPVYRFTLDEAAESGETGDCA